jgi:hypothetical protein
MDMLRYEAHTDADPDSAWALFAQPSRWPEWSPHLRGAWGLGTPEVEVGRRGAVRLLGAVPIPAAILAKEATPDRRSWTWRAAGLVDMDHVVERHPGGGCTVAITMKAAAPIEATLRVTYGPVVGLLLKNLARVAGDVSRSARARRRPTGTGTPAA